MSVTAALLQFHITVKNISELHYIQDAELLLPLFQIIWIVSWCYLLCFTVFILLDKTTRKEMYRVAYCATSSNCHQYSGIFVHAICFWGGKYS